MQIIPKFQQGGFSSLFTTYTPTTVAAPQQIQTTQTTTQTTKTTDKDDNNFTQKELVKLLDKVDGLPNDMQAIGNNIINSLQLAQLGGTASDIASSYLSNLLQVKQAVFNKKEYDNAYKQVTQNDGLNEYAVTASGNLVAFNKETEDIEEVPIKDYWKNQDKYDIMTNSNLLYIRSHSPQYVNKNNILETISNGIGMNQINKLIKERLINLGTRQISNEGYSVKIGSEIRQGLEVLNGVKSRELAGKTGMTLDGLYKNKVITIDQKEQAESALLYIYHSLPVNAQAILKLHSGNKDNPTDGAINLIAALITSTTRSSIINSTNWKGTLEQVLASPNTKNGSKSSSSGSNDTDSKAKSGPYTDMVRMIGGNETQISINKGTNYQIDVRGVNYPSLTDTSGKPVGKTSLDNLLNSGLQGIITDRNAITFGNVQLQDTDFNNIMYSGSGGTMTILPTKISDNGRKIVDLEVLDRWETANKELRNIGINSVMDENHQQQIAKVLLKYDLDGLVDMGTGTVDYSKLGQFLIIDGYAVDNTSRNRFGNSDYVSHINDDPDVISMIEKALSTDDNKYTIDPDNWYDFNGHDNLYKGSIYIPITINEHQAQTAEGQKLSQEGAQIEEGKYQMLQKRLRAKSASKEQLG